jgi:hypothetical protein
VIACEASFSHTLSVSWDRRETLVESDTVQQNVLNTELCVGRSYCHPHRSLLGSSFLSSGKQGGATSSRYFSKTEGTYFD